VGAWGTAVFSDDDACDARDGFRELIAEGLSPEEATARLVAELGFPEAATGAGGALWIGLAVTQWKTGRLLPWVRDRALAEIAAESSDRWPNPADWNKRSKVLAQTAAMLRAPQRAPVRIKREAVPESPFAGGDIVRFTLDSGHEVALWALTRRERRSRTRVCVDTPFVLLAFGDPALGSVDRLVAGPPVLITDESGRSNFVQLHLWLPQDAASSRWSVIGNAAVPAARQDPRGFRSSINLRKRPGTADEHANRALADYHRHAARGPSDAGAAQLAIAELLPDLPRLWDGFLTEVPRSAAKAVADLITRGDTEQAGRVLALAERQLVGPPGARQTVRELIASLLRLASDPTGELERERLLELLGPRASALVPQIDAGTAL
jgi:hypothetical protein